MLSRHGCFTLPAGDGAAFPGQLVPVALGRGLWGDSVFSAPMCLPTPAQFWSTGAGGSRLGGPGQGAVWSSKQRKGRS